jgi:hypothetical protein
MDIKLPTLTIQPSWTAESQLVKCQEELDEIKEAIAAHDDVNAIREAFDLIQTGHTFLQIMDESYDGHLNTGKFLAEHEAKLKRKGYME